MIVNFDRPTQITALAAEVKERRARSAATDQALRRAGFNGVFTTDYAIGQLAAALAQSKEGFAKYEAPVKSAHDAAVASGYPSGDAVSAIQQHHAAWLRAKSRVEELERPVPLILHCPVCHTRHVDEGEQATTPHRTHACQNPRCGHLWAPAVVTTVGVWTLPGCLNPVVVDTHSPPETADCRWCGVTGVRVLGGRLEPHSHNPDRVPCQNLDPETRPAISYWCQTCDARGGQPCLSSRSWPCGVGNHGPEFHEARVSRALSGSRRLAQLERDRVAAMEGDSGTKTAELVDAAAPELSHVVHVAGRLLAGEHVDSALTPRDLASAVVSLSQAIDVLRAKILSVADRIDDASLRGVTAARIVRELGKS